MPYVNRVLQGELNTLTRGTSSINHLFHSYMKHKVCRCGDALRCSPSGRNVFVITADAPRREHLTRPARVLLSAWHRERRLHMYARIANSEKNRFLTKYLQALQPLEARGTLFVTAGEDVYEGVLCTLQQVFDRTKRNVQGW